MTKASKRNAWKDLAYWFHANRNLLDPESNVNLRKNFQKITLNVILNGKVNTWSFVT